jgi:signal transduction histidine kinase
MALMSHELRTPLNAIMGFVDLLLDDYCGPLNKCQNDFLSDVKLSSTDLLELINRLLDLSKIEAGELELDIKGINVETLLNHIQTILKPLCRKKNLEFHIENLATSEFINGDFVRMKEILFNLLNNAMKFTQKGSIILKVKEKNDYFEFDIIDTGIGIAESEYGNIFEEFKKVNNPEIRDSQGMGLGLAITNHLVKLHGGQVSFSSEVGKGSIFTFTIPKENMKVVKE